jgi:hypothetical protein
VPACHRIEETPPRHARVGALPGLTLVIALTAIAVHGDQGRCVEPHRELYAASPLRATVDGMRFVLGGFVVLFILALAIGAITGRVKARSCCSLSAGPHDPRLWQESDHHSGHQPTTGPSLSPAEDVGQEHGEGRRGTARM